MTYFQGFLIPVNQTNRGAYLALATEAAQVFADYGALQTVECWEDDVTDGKVTDFRQAVQASADESVVFSWVSWPDKTHLDAVSAPMMADARMMPAGPMPFDAQRMIYGGFTVDFDSGLASAAGYVDGMVASLPAGDTAAFSAFVKEMAGFFRDAGATRAVDGWGSDVPEGKLTDFYRAVKAMPGEAIVFGWVEWPDKETRERGMGALLKHPHVSAMIPPWNGRYAIFGGFAPLLDHRFDASEPATR